MRTTIHIDDHLFAELKKRAADSGRTLAATIQDAVRESLYRRGDMERPAADLPVFHGTGILPGVVFNDSVALLDLMSKDDGAA